MTTKGWSHKDEWKKSGKDFLVSVVRHTVKSYDDLEGPNRWAVYAYIYPGHPHFANFDGGDMWQGAASIMPLHCGPSYLQRHYRDDLTVCSIQVGADYHHHDDNFTYDSTPDDAYQVFADAKDLFDWLEANQAANQAAIQPDNQSLAQEASQESAL